ncbi:MAG: polyphosphate kinase 1, partial [Ginsengibacter sp.]
INIPSPAVTRFFHFETRNNIHYIIWLDDILRLHLDHIFPGYTVHDSYSIKLNRDEDYEIEDEFDGDLVKKIKDKLAKRGKSSEPIRLLYDKTIPEKVLKQVIKNGGLKGFEGIPGGRYHNMNDLFQFPNPVGQKLSAQLPAPLPHTGLEHASSIFQPIEEKDQLLCYPYHSYDYVLRFFNEAVTDPLVEEIKVALYRIDKNSTIAHALMNASRNGKKVTAFVEIKARYDELNNLYWAEEMEKAGVHIIYSMPGIKVHSKIALIHKNDGNGKKKKYAYLSTGNFNEKTATIYSDFGFFTMNNDIIRETEAIFKFLSTGKKPGPLNHLLVAPFNMKKEISKLINNEIEAAKNGKPCGIILKVNGLDEKEIIEKLYEASDAGVSIQIIVRAGCALIPQKKGLSENISAYRLVGKYLEHARVLYFKAEGKGKIFLSSADLMNRNLNRRIEVGFPIYDEAFKKDIKTLLEIQLRPDVKKTPIQQNKFTQSPEKSDLALDAQDLIYEWIKHKDSIQKIKN